MHPKCSSFCSRCLLHPRHRVNRCLLDIKRLVEPGQGGRGRGGGQSGQVRRDGQVEGVRGDLRDRITGGGRGGHHQRGFSRGGNNSRGGGRMYSDRAHRH